MTIGEFRKGKSEARETVSRLIELVEDERFADNGFDVRWHSFVTPWQKGFTIDVMARAKSHPDWVPTEKQLLHIRTVIARLQQGLEDLLERL